MKSITTKVAIITAGLLTCFSSMAQEVDRMLPPGYDPHYDKIIPDKVFELGLPLLLLFIIANTIMSVFKIKADNKLREKAIDKGISEPTLVSLFAEDNHLYKYVFFKWFLILAAFGLSLIFIYFLFHLTRIRSGYLAIGIITLFMSFAFLIYSNRLQKR